jgi:multiple antibiotic resistance protein
MRKGFTLESRQIRDRLGFFKQRLLPITADTSRPLMTAPLITLLLQKAFVVFATLTPIINAPGMAPIFLTLTDGLSNGTRSRVARQIAISGFLLVIGSVLIGSPLLAFFGVSLPVLRIAGGMLVTATAWQLLHG